METHKTEAVLEPDRTIPDEPVTLLLRIPRAQHAKFKSKCALRMTSMQAFLLGKIDEFAGAE